MTGGPVQHDAGAVAIGRNEGDRLVRCLESLRAALGGAAPIVYVDSGSADGSIERARALGAEVVELDLSAPFTAARARNAGLRALLRAHPGLAFVQFVDGDCELNAGWIPAAMDALAADERLAVACGRRRERFPSASVYNRLCDVEWDTPVGEATACGGDALIRVAALVAVGGYEDSMIAGEEPEMCLRLRRLGWRIRRLDAEMTLHDAAMTRLGQWWRRAVRSGHAYAEGAWRHGRGPERYDVRPVLSILVWSLAPPLFALALAWPTRGLSAALLLVYPIQALRTAWKCRARAGSARLALEYGLFMVLAKFAQAQGVLRFAVDRARGRRGRIIEYKDAPGPRAEGVAS